MAGYSKTYTVDYTSSGDTVYTGVNKLEDNIDDIITWINNIKKSYASASAPTSPAPDEGQIWWDSTNDLLNVYNGSTWVNLGGDTYKLMVDSGDGTPGYMNAKVQNSIVADETNHKIHLSGDNATPGNHYVYGTNASGTKGFYAISTIPTLKCGVSSNDTTPGYLNGKLVAGTNITLTEGSDGGDETLTIANSYPTSATAGNYIDGTWTLPNEVTVSDTSYDLAATIYISRGGTYRFVVVSNSAWQTDDISGWSAGDTAELYTKVVVGVTFTLVYRGGSPVGVAKLTSGDKIQYFAACSESPMVNGGLYTDLTTTTVS